MLDSQFTLFSIEASSHAKAEAHSNALLFKACNVYIFGEGRIYSEFEEMTFDTLNSNDYGCGTLEIEFVFTNRVTQEPYPNFYTKCFVIRTDTKSFIKPMKTKNTKCRSKIDQNGDLVLGIRYYFRNEEEIKLIQNCSALLVEGFIALKKPQNVFGIMCQLKKQEATWQISSAYTYRPEYARNIKQLID